MIASGHNHANVVRILHQAGAQLERASDNGATSLFIATLCGHIAVVETLIKNGASVNVATKVVLV